MPKVVFVILHYLGIEDTLECIESIKNNVKYNNYEIVIIDNASHNKTGKVLKDTFELDNSVHVILNAENLGFARGNNIGYCFAKNELKAEYIIIMNNDTLILDSEFINSFIDYYNKSPFHVLGPQIISTKDRINQNPLSSVLETKIDVIKSILRYCILYVLNLLFIEELVKKTKKKVKKTTENNIFLDNNKEKKDEIIKNVPLHGSCLVFSELFIKNMEYAFYPKTFLFVEEDILYYICKEKKFNMIYFPKSKVYHKEDSATNILMDTEKKKRRFLYKNIIKSNIEFYLYMQKNRSDY